MEAKPEIIWLKSFIEECGGVLNAASKLNIRPSTLMKFLNSKSLSPQTMKKLDSIMKRRNDLVPLGLPSSTLKVNRLSVHRPSLLERLHEVYNLYKEKGTLEAVGRQIGVTRERVRQLLVQGSKLGLFEYRPYDYPFVPKEKILDDFRRCLSKNEVAKANGITTNYLHELLTAYNITPEDLRSLRINGHKLQCIEQYNHIKNKLGHHPTTTELQKVNSWRYHWMKIDRLYGSFNAFREELNIPKPPQGSYSFSEDTRKWREQKQRLAFIVRMQHLEQLSFIVSNFTKLLSCLLKLSDQTNVTEREKFRAETSNEELRAFSNMCIALTTKDNYRLYRQLGHPTSDSKNKQLKTLYYHFYKILNTPSDVERARLRRLVSAEALAQMSDMIASLESEAAVQDFNARRKIAINL